MTEQEDALRRQLLIVIGQAKEAGLDQLNILNGAIHATATAALADKSLSDEDRATLQELM